MTDSTSAEAEPTNRETSSGHIGRAILPWLRTAVRVGLGGIWIVAGALKVGDLAQSVEAVAAYRLLPAPLTHLVGWGLPFAEVVLGLLLMSGLFTRWSAVVSGGLQLILMLGLVSAWVRGLSIDCGCFSPGGRVAPDATTYVQSLIRDFIFLLGAAWLVWQPVTRLSLDSVSGGLDGDFEYLGDGPDERLDEEDA
jgi:uncharacterized membrane protein YphA (DoxX/SURF4 family)